MASATGVMDLVLVLIGVVVAAWRYGAPGTGYHDTTVIWANMKDRVAR